MTPSINEHHIFSNTAILCNSYHNIAGITENLEKFLLDNKANIFSYASVMPWNVINKGVSLILLGILQGSM